MSRYIDADAVLKSIGASEHCKDCECKINNYECRGHSLSRQDICDIVDTISTADVKPVVRGKWRKIDKLGRTVKCSKCGNTLALYGVNAGRGNANFCPNCGADMRGGSNDH